MTVIDGSFGEGGGQILRSCLTLSMITKKAFTINNIRAKREKSGLLRQHLTCVNAAGLITNAEIKGNSLGSKELYFNPGNIDIKNYNFSVGSAGSTGLVMQTILPALLFIKDKMSLTFEGGTHNSMSPPYNFIEKSFFGILRKMGAKITSSILDYGFYPAGGGKFRVNIEGINSLSNIELTERKEINHIKVTAIISSLPEYIATNEINLVKKELNLKDEASSILEVKSAGPGNVLFIEVETEEQTIIFTTFGEKRISLKEVAFDCIEETKRFLRSSVCVDEHLADQILIPIVLSGKGKFRTNKPSMHTLTNIEVIKKFIDINIETKKIEEDVYDILIGG